MDWSLGQDEHIAIGLAPAAATVIGIAAPTAGERVVDIGCGTGNAALLAAERGASVVGVDPAPRLLAVARALAAARGLEAEFVRGQAEALPLPDACADAVTSRYVVVTGSPAQP